MLGPERASTRQTHAATTTLNASQIRRSVIFGRPHAHPSRLSNAYRPAEFPTKHEMVMPSPRRSPPPLTSGPATLGPGRSPGLSFTVIRRAKSKQPRGIVLARLICVRCKRDVKSVLRCRACGALCPTSRIGAALLSPGAFAFYGLILVVVAILWFA